MTYCTLDLSSPPRTPPPVYFLNVSGQRQFGPFLRLDEGPTLRRAPPVDRQTDFPFPNIFNSSNRILKPQVPLNKYIYFPPPPLCC